jgi:hypothetical protein
MEWKNSDRGSSVAQIVIEALLTYLKLCSDATAAWRRNVNIFTYPFKVTVDVMPPSDVVRSRLMVCFYDCIALLVYVIVPCTVNGQFMLAFFHHQIHISP